MKSNGKSLFDLDFLRGSAILLLLFIIAVSVPFLGSISLVFTPIPIVYYGLRLGRAKGVALTVICLAILTAAVFVTPISINLIVLYLFALLGLMLSEIIKRGYNIEKIVVYPTFLLCLAALSILVYHGWQTGRHVFEVIAAQVSVNIQESIKIYAQLDLPSEQIDIIKDNAQKIVDFLSKIYPALLIVAVSFTVWINVLGARALLDKTAVAYPSIGELSNWKAPDRTVWFVIAGGLIWLFLAGDAGFIGLNLIIICAFIYFMQGLAIVSYVFKKKKVPNVLKMIFYFIIFAQQYILLLVVVVGLSDLWIDFRKRIKPLNDAAAS